MADARSVVIRFLGDASGLNRAADQGAGSVSKFSEKTQKVAKAAMVGVAGLAAGAVAFIKGGVDGIREGEEAEAAFAQTMSKVPASIQGATDAITANAEAIQSRTRFSYEDALATSGFIASQDALQSAVVAGTTSVEDLTNLTLDLATAQGIDGPAAASKLAKFLAAPEKASAGLLKMGVKLTDAEKAKIKAWTESGDTAKAQGLILDRLKEKSEGAAEAAGNTTAGKMARAQAAFGEVQETLAAKLIPALTTLMGWLLKAAQWAEANPGKIKLVVIVLGTLAAIVGTVSLAVTVWSAITAVATGAVTAFWAANKLLNAAMNANPAVKIVGLIVLLVGIFVTAWKTSETFRRIVTSAFNAVKNAAQSVWQWIQGAWGGLKDILSGPFSAAKSLISGYVKGYITVVSKIKDGIVKVFSGVAGIITAPFRAAVDGIKSAWNSTLGGKGFSAPDWVPGIGGKGFHIPMLATGGTVTGRGWAMVGERGPELLNLGRGAQVVPLDRAGGGEENFTVELHGNGVSLEGLIEKVVVRRDRGLVSAFGAGARRTV